MVFFDYETQREITREMIQQGEMNEKYSLITMFLDGTHRIMNKQKHLSIELQIPFKLKNIAYNSIVSKLININK